MRRNTLLILASLPLVLLLWGFTPFTQVQNVCPECPTAKMDVVVFNSGLKVSCNVVAMNNDYYVLELFGEYRAAARSEVQSIEWRDPNRTTPPAGGDQVLTKNNVLYHGQITAEQAGRFLMIQVGSVQHTIWLSQIYNLHKAGAPQAVEKDKPLQPGTPSSPSAGPAAAPAPAAQPTAPVTPAPTTTPAPAQPTPSMPETTIPTPPTGNE